jgi:hypothetical protein
MRTARVPPVAIAAGHKYCFECNSLKPVSEFGIESAKPDGLRHICKCCDRARAKRYRATPRGKAVGKAYREKLRKVRRGIIESQDHYGRAALA